MNNLLPGLDVNDVAKCGLVFQILSILMTLVPIVDCSQAPLTCKDLTPEEIDLCSETASFEFFVEELMRKIFSMIMLLGGCVTDRQDLTSTKTVGKNVEEIVIEKGALIVFRALVKNCSSAFYKYITDQYYNFVNEHLFNSKPAMDTITKMVGSIVAHWAEPVNKDELSYDWHVPSDEEVNYALKLVDQFITSPLQNVLTNFKELTDKEIQRNLKIAHNALTGCSNLCPFFDGEVLSLIPMATPNIVLMLLLFPGMLKILAIIRILLNERGSTLVWSIIHSCKWKTIVYPYRQVWN
ncbi:hypothetical protein Mgra_00009856 [Meloidogyne graminicola]|uniref:Proteasome activator Blm10 middle HEAT repeats region domain-containing protein n=1 Tax=Meloidogyne graminicola TaxID=189291 RepID=A0A8S9ZCW6_9BILA|nr:hypothetical protein Mgra_00009856 [Meloidogyne graminicola]